MGDACPDFLVTNSNGIYALHFHSEQAPNRANRLRLTTEQDRLGMRRVSVEFIFSPQELTPIRKAHGVFDRSIRRLGIGELIYRGTVEESTSQLQLLPDGLHQIGSTRMSNDQSIGIVNRDCRVFDFENLYIAGSSIFPTSGQASPTLPAVTLAVRLSEHLEQTKGKQSAMQKRDGLAQDSIEGLNILFVTASYYPAVRYGGPIYTVHSLARALVNRGNRVVVYTTNIDGDQVSNRSSVASRVIDGVAVRYYPTLIDRILHVEKNDR